MKGFALALAAGLCLLLIAAMQSAAAPVAAQAAPTATPPALPGRVWPQPAADARAHFWLSRPFTPALASLASSFYPFSSTGQGAYLVHHGVDIEKPLDTPVFSTAPGVVIYAQHDLSDTLGLRPNFYGNAVVVRLHQPYHDLPVFVLYGHLNRILVQPGQTVQTGDLIGLVGMTGVAIGPHLHLEVRVGQNRYSWSQNPDLWLAPPPGHGVLVGRLVDQDGRIWPQAHLLLYRTTPKRQYVREWWAYVDQSDIRPDPYLAETFAIPDLLAGEYLLEVAINGQINQRPLTITAGEATFVDWEIASPLPDLPEWLPRVQHCGWLGAWLSLARCSP